MKKIFFMLIVFALAISACATSKNPSVPASGAANPSPISEKDLRATSDALVQQTLQAMPTPTLQPSNTPVVVTETATVTASPTQQVTPTETQNPILLTLTATLGTGTPFTTPGTPAFGTLLTQTVTVTPTGTLTSAYTATSEPNYPQTYGTMPPSVPAAKVAINNQAKVQAYVSVHCTTKDGYTSFVESPIAPKSRKSLKIPAGSCSVVAWVGGRSFSTSFHVGAGGNATLVVTAKGVAAK